MSVTGRVMDAGGRAVTGARVAVVPWRPVSYGGRDVSDRLDELLAQARTDRAGRCRLDVAHAASEPGPFAEGGLLGTGDVLALAAAPGQGLAWQHLSPFSRQAEEVIRLPREQVIHGRLIDLQGQPAAGVKLQVLWVGRRGQVWRGVWSHLVTPYPGVVYYQRKDQFARGLWTGSAGPGLRLWPGPLVTDAGGRFALRGIGRDHIVLLEVRDEPFGHQWFEVQTDAAGPVKSVLRSLAPARVIEGQVVYADTGKPAAGAQVVLYQNLRRLLMTVRKYERADARGRFRLNPCGDAFVEAKPPGDQAYQRKSVEVKWAGGAGLTRQVKLTLRRGVLLRGTVTEAATGKPVAGARVMYWSESEAYNLDRVVRTGADEAFRVGAEPGRGQLLVHAGLDYVVQEDSSGLLQRGVPGGRRLYPHGWVELRLGPRERARTVAVRLKRGVTVRGRLLGPDGKPPARALMLSRRLNVSRYHLGSGLPVEVAGGRFELRGCDPAGTYRVLFLDPKGGSGAVAQINVKRAARTPPTVRLAPCGSAVVRFVDGRGKPVADYNPDVYLVLTPAFFPTDTSNLTRLLAQPTRLLDGVLGADMCHLYWSLPTDERGFVRCPYLIPGATYQIRWGRAPHERYTMAQDFRVKAGQRLRLPDIVLRGIR
jgi:hypothetical protein